MTATMNGNPFNNNSSPQKKRKSTCNDDDLAHIKDAIMALSVTNQKDLFSSLVGELKKPLLSHIYETVSPLLKVDILQNLPHELACHILSFLDVQSLISLSCVSLSYWYLVMNDSYIWQQICMRYGYGLPRESYPFYCLRKKTNSDSSLMLNFFKYIYCTNKNWRINKFLSKSIPGPSSNAIITCMQFDSNYLVIATDSLPFGVLQVFDFKSISNKDKGEEEEVLSFVKRNSLLPPPTKSFMEIHNSAGVSRSNYLNAEQNNNNNNNHHNNNNNNENMPNNNQSFSGKAFRGHEGGVWGMEFCGDILASGGCDRDLRIWSLSSGECLMKLQGHASTIRCLKIINENLVVTGSRDNTLRVWDISSIHTAPKNKKMNGSCMATLLGHTGSIRCMAFYGGKLVSGSYDSTVRIWDIQKFIDQIKGNYYSRSKTALFFQNHTKPLHVLTGPAAQIYSVAINDDFVCSGSLDSDICVWDLHTGVLLYTLTGHEALVGHIQFRPNNILVSGGSDGRIFVWDIENGKVLSRINAHYAAVTTLHCDGDRIFSGGDDGVKIWDMSGTLLRHQLEHVNGIWKLQATFSKLVVAVQREDETTLEIMDFGHQCI
jgi:F-box and WD-40 domain protein CDC4